MSQLHLPASSFKRYTQFHMEHWNRIFSRPDRFFLNRYYHKRLQRIYRFLIPENSRVLEIGSGGGSLLASLRPAYGVGLDFSEKAVSLARSRYPELTFIKADVHQLEIQEDFEFIVLSDIVNDLWDVQEVLCRIRSCCSSGTRVIINTYSRIWEIPLSLSRKTGMAKPLLRQNWLTPADLRNLFALSGFETIRNWKEMLLPIRVPLITTLLNRIVVHIWPFSYFSLADFLVGRPVEEPKKSSSLPTVSVIVPARNEAGNIEHILDRTPVMGSGTEIVFVEGNSTDNTYDAIEAAIKKNPRTCQLHKQSGKGKGDAVRLGFEKATGDILMILDADLTVAPEELIKFYDALVSGKADFINGVRLVYPMQDKAMRFFNLLANKFFSLSFSWLFGQPIKDTLCGTKVLWKKDYLKIRNNRSYFGEFDPFGDFDLLFGAVKLHFKIIDIPIRYAERTYGTTNISRWKHGLLLFRMVALAGVKIKFV